MLLCNFSLPNLLKNNFGCMETSLYKFFRQIPDPRNNSKRRHLLIDIIINPPLDFVSPMARLRSRNSEKQAIRKTPHCRI